MYSRKIICDFIGVIYIERRRDIYKEREMEGNGRVGLQSSAKALFKRFIPPFTQFIRVSFCNIKPFCLLF